MINSKLITIVKESLYPISLYARQIAGTIVLLLIARYLTVYDFGLFSSYKNIARYLFIFANLHFHDYILVSTKAEPSKVRQKIALFMMNAIFLGIIYSIASLLFNVENHILFILVIVRTFFDGVFFNLILPYFQATKKFKTIAWINIEYSIGTAIIAIVSFIFKLSLIKFLVLCIILGLFNFIQCSFYININYLGVITKIKKYLQLLDNRIWGYIGSCLLVVLCDPLPALFVSIYVSKEQAALYFAAFTIASVISLLLVAQEQKIKPQLVKANAENSKSILKKYIMLILTVTGVMFLFMLLFGKYILVLFYGKAIYANAYMILLILMFANILYGITLGYSAYITSKGYQYKTIPMRIEFAICCLSTLFIFSKIGIYGAAISYLITMIYMLIRYKIFSDYLLKHNS